MTSPRVLIVEDEHDAREILRESLEFEGYSAESASDGRDAIRVLESSGEPPSLILLDLMMPGMDGWSFREWQRAHPAHGRIPVVVLSAVRNLRQEAKDLGAAGFLEKPIQFEALVDEVRRVVGPPRAA